MPSIRLKGINRVSKRRADGSSVTYWYAWKGGPRLEGEPGSPEFVASFAKAAEKRKLPSADTLAGLVIRYKAAPEYTTLAPSTRAEWLRWLDRITLAKIGSIPIAALDDRKVLRHLMAWRDTYADRPRTADYGVQVLSRVMEWGRKRGFLAVNVMAGTGRLHKATRAESVWSATDLAAFCEKAPQHVSRAMRLACLTGLRRGDLIALTWEEIGETTIMLKTRKTGALATIPLLPATKTLLAEIGRRKGPVLLTSRGTPWTANGLETMIIKARNAAGLTARLHDARGTFATNLRLAGWKASQIADAMGWEEKRVERLLAIYVDPNAVIRDLASRRSRNAKST